MTPQECAEELDHFLSLGESPYQTARSLGMTTRTLERYMHQVNRPDLASALTPFAKIERFGVSAS